MKTTHETVPGPRRDRLIHEHIHDPYKRRLKIAEPTVCPDCGAVYQQGRWQWAESHPFDAPRELCQACQRIRDRYPAGVVTLTGTFLPTHREEILNLIRHLETQEKNEHPLHRIMSLEEHPDSIVVNTTDIHLPRRIGEALEQAYEGELQFHYEEETYFIRVHWRRDA